MSETRVIRGEIDRQTAINYLKNIELPATVSFKAGASRSVEQNSLQRKWLLEAQAQGDMTAEEYRAECKLCFGVPILRHENDEFREKYDRIIKPLPYHVKLEYMAEPFDFPVTRVMTIKQKTAYLNKMFTHFQSLGFVLTQPLLQKQTEAV